MGKIALIYWFAINVVTFVMYGVDKWKSKHARWRIPESTLIWMAVLGGSVGALLGIRCWHHKTLHAKFRFGVPAILMVQILIVVFVMCWITKR